MTVQACAADPLSVRTNDHNQQHQGGQQNLNRLYDGLGHSLQLLDSIEDVQQEETNDPRHSGQCHLQASGRADAGVVEVAAGMGEQGVIVFSCDTLTML